MFVPPVVTSSLKSTPSSQMLLYCSPMPKKLTESVVSLRIDDWSSVTPGASNIRSMKSRLRRGSSSTRRLSTTVRMVLSVVWTRGPTSVTVTDSVACPTSSSKSTFTSPATERMTPGRVPESAELYCDGVPVRRQAAEAEGTGCIRQSSPSCTCSFVQDADRRTRKDCAGRVGSVAENRACGRLCPGVGEECQDYDGC